MVERAGDQSLDPLQLFHHMGLVRAQDLLDGLANPTARHQNAIICALREGQVPPATASRPPAMATRPRRGLLKIPSRGAAPAQYPIATAIASMMEPTTQTLTMKGRMNLSQRS